MLYVEDNDDNAYVMQKRLGRAGHAVLVARDGGEGIAMVSAESPDFVLRDLSMPGLHGWEATRRLKAAPETRAIPVLALSSNAMAGDRETALAAGCDGYDTKPIGIARLRGKIDALLARAVR